MGVIAVHEAEPGDGLPPAHPDDIGPVESIGEPRDTELVWRYVTTMRLVTTCLAAFTATAGGLVFAGWLAGSPFLAGLLPGVPMAPTSAIALTGASLAFLCLAVGDSGRLRTAIGGLLGFTVLLTAFAALYRHFARPWQFGLDYALTRGLGDEVVRMPPNSAVGFLAVGLGVLAYATRGPTIAQACGLTATAIGLIGAVGYATGVPQLYGFAARTVMSLPTALGLAALGMAILFGRPDTGPVQLLARDTPGAALARRVLPVAIGLPPLVAAAVGFGQRIGWYANSAVSQVTSIVLIVALATVAWSVAMALDRTDRVLRAADARIAVERERSAGEIDRFFAVSLDLLSISDRTGTIKRVNPAWAEVLGYEAAALEGSRFGALLHPADVDRTAVEFVKIAGGERIQGFENRLRASDGSYRWLQWKIAAVPELDLVYSAARDVTAARAAEEALAAARDSALAASRVKSQFLATMSHEIRTPISGVIGLTGLLLGTRLDPTQTRYAEGIHTSGEALLGVINDILDFSKIEAGKVVIEQAPFDLVRLVDGAVQVVAEPARAKGLALTGYCAPPVPRSLVGDAGRLRQVLLNFASNAVKFTERGEVVIRASAVDDPAGDPAVVMVRFEVSDTGIGVRTDDGGGSCKHR